LIGGLPFFGMAFSSPIDASEFYRVGSAGANAGAPVWREDRDGDRSVKREAAL
jgi:hypothetical protein